MSWSSVPADLLLATGGNTGRMADGSPIPDAISRAMAADGRRRRMLTDLITAQTLDAGADRYEPSTRLAEHIRGRDQHCRWPGCRRPAHRSELDHTVAFRSGGRSVRANLAALCASGITG
jgi:hypothetical protein